MYDPCRRIDNIQNTNAVYLDSFGQKGKTSIKTMNPPGGQSHFSLGWDDNSNQQPPQQNYGRKRFQPEQPFQPGFGNVDKRDMRNNYGNNNYAGGYGNNNYAGGYGNNNYAGGYGNNNAGGVHTSVRVSNNPGGRSNIVFGTDKINYDDYRK